MPEAPLISLAGKRVVQWGASGLLGRALARGLVTAGAEVILVSRETTRPDSLPAAPSPGPGTLAFEQADLGHEASIHALRDRLMARHGRIDGFVYNAVARPMRSMEDDLATWRESMEVNATGLFAASRVFGDAMAAAGRGSIVMIASIQGMVGHQPSLYEGTALTSRPDYFFHKAGMLNLTRYLASHYGTRGVRVNTVSPGGIYDPATPQQADFIARYNPLTMLGRMADASEITGSVAFLLSDAATYVTGINLPVDGGYTAK